MIIIDLIEYNYQLKVTNKRPYFIYLTLKGVIIFEAPSRTCVCICLFLFRSPNRKLREATDRVGDKLRAYAQKFKVSIDR